MQPLDIVVSSLKWLSQFVVLVSATSAMFQELYVKDPETGRRRLTRSGWVHLTGLLLGFVLFGVTEIHDQQKAARERIEAATNETRLQSLLETQKTIEQGLRTQIDRENATECTTDRN